MKTLITFGLGALTMYLFDVEHGRMRRARMREQLTRAKRVVNTQLERVKLTETRQAAQHLGR